MISAKELDFFKAQEQFHRMCEFLERALAEGQRVDQVERGLFPQAMTMCLELLRSFVAAHGDGDQGETLEREGETLHRLPEPHDKRYLSIFGELLIGRWVYGTREGQAIEWSPLGCGLGVAGRRELVCAGGLVAAVVHPGSLWGVGGVATCLAGDDGECSHGGAHESRDVPVRGGLSRRSDSPGGRRGGTAGGDGRWQGRADASDVGGAFAGGV